MTDAKLLERVRRRLAPDAEILVNEESICTGEDWDEVRDYLSLLRLADDLTTQRDQLRDQVTDLKIANGMKAGEIERLTAELAIARRLRAAHRAIVDSVFAHQEACTVPTAEEKARLMAEWEAAEKAFKSEVQPVETTPVQPHKHEWVNARLDGGSWLWACRCGEKRQLPPPLKPE